VDEDCPGAKKSALFKDSGLYYSYKACGNDADMCFDGDEYDQYSKAADEDHSDDDEHTIDDVIEAVIILTVRVNDIAGTVNGLSTEVQKLQTEAGFTPVVPDALPVTAFSEDNLWSETNWAEAACSVGYKMIKSGEACDEAGAALGYAKIENKNNGDQDVKACTYCAKCSPPGYRMAKTYGENEPQIKLLCRNGSE